VQTILIATDAETVHELRHGPMHDPEAGRRLDAVKLFLDGTLGGRTACLHRPYADGSADDRGMLTLPAPSAYAQLVDAHTAGLQVCIHAIGDRANRTAADLYARLLREHPGPHRHRVEHASSSTPDDRSPRRLDITAVVQPISLESELAWLARRLGDERWTGCTRSGRCSMPGDRGRQLGHADRVERRARRHGLRSSGAAPACTRPDPDRGADGVHVRIRAARQVEG
jgi:predicted amidohydrolase YtcJ